MSISDRKQRQRAELRRRILASARAIVVREGFAALTMRRLAEAIEYAPATIYLHFANRAAIAQALAVEGFVALLAALRPCAAIVDASERIIALGRAYVRFGLAEPEAYRLIFMGDADFTKAAFPPQADAAANAGTAALGLLRQAASDLVAQGRAPPDADAAALADTVWVIAHGIVSLKLTCPGFPATPADALTDGALRGYLAGLACVARGLALP
jgi:AcrR family transcriptional regulator